MSWSVDGPFTVRSRSVRGPFTGLLGFLKCFSLRDLGWQRGPALKYKVVRYRTLGSEVKLRECDCNCKAVSVSAFLSVTTSGGRGPRFARR
jgi:hypothetical protein